MMNHILSVLLAALLVSGCATTAGIKPLTDQEYLDVNHQEDVARLHEKSDELYQQFSKQGLIYDNPDGEYYINQLASQLAPAFEANGVALRLFVIKNATPNAIALPNGDIYLFSGLFALLENEHQLASIIAHEIGHVVYQHGLQAALQRRNAIVSAHIADLFLFGTSIAYLPAIGSIASFSREQEQQADEASLMYLDASQFNINQSPKVFELFSTLPEAMSVKGSVYSSHPSNEERISYLKKMINNQYTVQTSRPIVNEQFDRLRADLLELNIRLRLRAKQYQTALQLLDQAEAFYPSANKINYYRAEVYRHMAEHPMATAKEVALLEGRTLEAKDKQWAQDQVSVFQAKAKKQYLATIDNPNPPAEAFRGLGLVLKVQGDHQSAKSYLETYLAMNSEAKDRLYINHIITQLDQQKVK